MTRAKKFFVEIECKISQLPKKINLTDLILFLEAKQELVREEWKEKYLQYSILCKYALNNGGKIEKITNQSIILSFTKWKNYMDFLNHVEK